MAYPFPTPEKQLTAHRRHCLLHPPFRTTATAVGAVAHLGGEADALEKEVSAANEVAKRLVGDDAPPHRLPERHALRPLGGAHLQLPGE